MLSAAQISAFQAALTRSYDLSCQVQGATHVPDGYGSSSDVWVTRETVNCCLEQPSAGLLQNYEFLVGALDTWKVSFPSGTDVRMNDQLVFPTRANQAMRVQVVLEPEAYQLEVTVLAAVIM